MKGLFEDCETAWWGIALCLLILGVGLTVTTTACVSMWYYHDTFKMAVEAGLEQEYIPGTNQIVWVRAK